MPRQVGTSTENNFKAGLITEVTGVNSPENSVVDTLNVSYDRRGRAIKRKGFKTETEADLTFSVTGAKSEFVWETVADNTNKTFVIIQTGERIRFFSTENGTNLTEGWESFSVNLTLFKSSQFSDNKVANTQAAYAAGKGYLFIAHPMCDTIFVKYDSTDNSIETHSIKLKIRDFEGVDDGLGINNRPNNLQNDHKYNLLNQGWYANAEAGDTNDNRNVLDFWMDTRSDVPAHSDAWWYYLSSISPDEFHPDPLADSRAGFYGNTPVPKGHYIIDALNTNRKELSDIDSGVDEDSSRGYRPSCVAFYSGRAFYAGVGHPDFSSSVYFSQIIQQDTDLGKCYQLNDPTNKDTFDLLASDGGVVKIQDINTVLDMRVIGPSLFIFASNGVWSITGSNDGPFKATDYFVTKVSSFPALSRTTIVDIGGLPVWWNYEGIYALQRNEIGTADVQSISELTIQTFFDNIPQTSKQYAKGFYNDQDGLVYWVYNQNDSSNYDYTHILVWDTVTKAFYPYTIPTQLYDIFGIVAVRSDSPIVNLEPVVNGAGEQVVDSLGNDVIVEVDAGKTTSKKVFKFFCRLGDNKFNVASISDLTYLDWAQYDYDAYFITGYRIRGDLIRQFQTGYLEVLSEAELNSVCQVQGIWDYANSPNTGKFTNPQQCIRPDSLRDYHRRRLRMRGQGKSLQFKFYGSTGAPFTIIGWAGFELVNGTP